MSDSSSAQPFLKFKRFFLTTLLLAHLLPVPLGLAAWWLLTTEASVANDAGLQLAIFTAMGLSLLMALLTYIKAVRSLKRLGEHLAALKKGDRLYRSQSPAKGYFANLFTSLNDVGDQIERYAQHNQTELDIIKSEATRLRNVINSINDGVVALDKDLHIILFNKAAGNISGYSIEEAAGKPVGRILPLLKGNALVLNDWLQSIEGVDLRDQRWENLRLKTKEGKTRTVDVEVLYQGADPNGIRTLITFHDRTASQDLEDMKVDFVALAAHELRTPISVIRGYLEILEDELGNKLTVEQANFMSKLNVSAAQLSGFINNILHVSRIEHGDLNLKLEVSDWGKLVQTAVEDLKTKAALQDKQLKLTIEPKLPKVAVDKMSIVEVLNNLIDNAIKYSARDSQITITVKRNGDTVETSVQDHGVGIPENAIDKLFTKFYRSHRTRTSHRGTGLGLYMSKAIVEAHGGNVWVHSIIDEGSTFGFMLPVYNKGTNPHQAVEANNKITRGVHGWIKNHSLYRG